MNRRDELAAAGALGQVSQEEAAEMSALGMSQDEIYAMEIAAAALSVATVTDEMPAHVAARMSGQPVQPPQSAQPTVPPQAPQAQQGSVVTLRRPVPKLDPMRIIPWIAAAACLLLAVIAVWRPWVPGGARSPSEERTKLIASAKDATVTPWTATNDPSGPTASGDVVWSNAQQKGFMRFKGVTPNDPKASQYQLWIFDEAQDEKFPVDGGVFDVKPGAEIIVPIRAKIDVKKPTMFAVTVEKPGGVVVSKREHIVVLAKL
jgi:anti-sigma-K factor RskA